MTYTRDELRAQSNPETSDPEIARGITETLLAKLHNREELTLAESGFICPRLSIIRRSENNQPLDPYVFPVCDTALFRSRYILYFNNVNGWYKAFDWYGEISPENKVKDLELINRHHHSWENTIRIPNHQNEILQNVCIETRHHIKEIRRYCKRQFMGGNRRDYLEKSIVLQSKYIYYLVLEYYQESNAVEYIELKGQTIRIDSFCFIHILFRHYSQLLKEHQIGKTYHEDISIDYKNIPKELFNIIQAYKFLNDTSFDSQKIYFSLNEKLYAIWFRRIRKNVPGGGIVEELRVQTLYPVEEIRERERVSKHFRIIRESEGFIFHLSQ